VLNDGQPKVDLPNGPVQITGEPGDAVITHHQMFHTAAPNHSPDIRYAAIFRVQHELRHEYLNQAYTNIWHEWEGLREALAQPEAKSGAPASMYA
jgi:ectoine hydroxylase-related dioxygenase (phytanoyl-CoA dioxygenase family)